jgi:hypothetical protein
MARLRSRLTRIGIAAAAATLLAACAGTPPSSHVLTGTKRPAIDAAQVKVYASVPANAEQVALIEASSRESGARTEQAMIDAVVALMKDEAAKLGANGIVLQRTETRRGGGVTTGVGLGVPLGGSSAVGFGVSSSGMHKIGYGIAIHVPGPADGAR